MSSKSNIKVRGDRWSRLLQSIRRNQLTFGKQISQTHNDVVTSPVDIRNTCLIVQVNNWSSFFHYFNDVFVTTLWLHTNIYTSCVNSIGALFLPQVLIVERVVYEYINKIERNEIFHWNILTKKTVNEIIPYAPETYTQLQIPCNTRYHYKGSLLHNFINEAHHIKLPQLSTHLV